MDGTVSVTERTGVTTHTYTAPESGLLVTTARSALAGATTGEALKEALVVRFPEYRGDALLDIQNMYLFSGEERSSAVRSPISSSPPRSPKATTPS
jgi:hypothetical protein